MIYQDTLLHALRMSSKNDHYLLSSLKIFAAEKYITDVIK